MKMKKILALLLGVALMLNMSAIYVGASSNTSEINNGEVDRMYSFGLIRSSHIFEKDSNVTRGEAAYAFKNMIGYDAAVNKKETPLADVEKNINEDEIYKVYAAGLMPCVYGTNFMPDQAVSYGDIVKAAAKLLGYNENVIGKDADFMTYLHALLNGKAVKNVVKAEKDSVTWSEFLMFLDTVLEADLMESTFSDGRTEIKRTDENILNNRMHIYECDGIMTKNEFSSLTNESAFANNQVEIGDTALINNNVHTLDMLGINMEAWYRWDESANDEKELLYIRPNSRRNRILKVNSDNLRELSIGEMTYEEGTRTKDVSFPKGIYLLYNGVAVSDYSDWDIHCENGSVTLIDNNNDGKYDVLSVINYDECVVYSKSSDNVIYDLHSSSRNLDVSDNDIKIFKDGTTAKYDDIKAYDVVSVLRTKDGRIVELIVTNNAVTGKISSVTKSGENGYASEVVINGTAFYTLKSFENVFDNTIRSGLEGTFYLDFNGNIVGYTKGEDNSLYAYVIKSFCDDNAGDDDIWIKMFTQDGTIGNFKVAEKPNVNGAACKNKRSLLTTVKPSLVIKYKINEKNEICWMETAFNDPDESDYREVGETAPEDRLRVTYSTKSDTVVYINAVGMFADKEKVSNKTIFFKVPLDVNETNPDFFAVGKRNMLVDAQKVYIQTYASSKDAIENDVCVVFENTKYSASSFLKAVPVGLVEDIYTGLNSDNETRTEIKITGQSGTATLQEYEGGYLNHIRAEKTSITTEFKLQKGDIIRYIQNSKGNIVYAEMLCRMNPDGTLEKLNAGHGIVDDYCLETGYVFKRQGNNIAFVSDEPSNSTTRNNWKVFDISKAKVFVYEDGRLNKGTIDDVVSYESNPDEYSKGVIHLMYGQPQVVYIYK